METTGKVIAILPLRSGISKNGKEWKSQEFVIEIPGNYPRKICINIFGDKIDTFNLQRGGNYHVFFDVDAKEFNGRWFNSFNAYKIEAVGNLSTTQSNSPQTQSNAQNPEPNPINNEGDLPF